MAKSKVITLAKKLDFKTEDEYFNYCADSYINGNYKQCTELFKDMSRTDQKRLLVYLNDIGDKDAYQHFFKQL